MPSSVLRDPGLEKSPIDSCRDDPIWALIHAQDLNNNYIILHFYQADFSHGAAQEVSAAVQERPGIEKPPEDVGSQGGHQARVHRAEAERGTTGEQEDEGREEWV